MFQRQSTLVRFAREAATGLFGGIVVLALAALVVAVSTAPTVALWHLLEPFGLGQFAVSGKIISICILLSPLLID